MDYPPQTILEATRLCGRKCSILEAELSNKILQSPEAATLRCTRIALPVALVPDVLVVSNAAVFYLTVINVRKNSQ